MSQLLLEQMRPLLIAAGVAEMGTVPVLEVETPQRHCLIDDHLDKWLMLLQDQPWLQVGQRLLGKIHS